MAKLFLVIALFAPVLSKSQARNGFESVPDSATMRASWNVISFALSQGKLHQLHNAKGEKLNLSVASMVVNEVTSEIKHLRVRGNTSSYFKRKSFNVDLKKKAHFHSTSDTFALKKFFAVCLNMDKNYVRNKISYDVLSFQHVSVPLSCYANLKINGASEGVYMIFYPPDDFAEKKCKSSLVIRRGYGETMDKIYEKNISRDEVRGIKSKYRSMYGASLKNFKGERLYQELSKLLNLESYFSFLAYNHLFQNGDYADELYFMWDTKQKKFDIIPWDLDDILCIAPHEGMTKRNEILGDKLIFSAEDKLDVAIANDAYVYRQYLKTYERFLEELTPDVFEKILHSIYQEVYVYFKDDQIIGQSKFDQHGATDLLNLKADLAGIFENVNNRATIMRHEVRSQLGND